MFRKAWTAAVLLALSGPAFATPVAPTATVEVSAAVSDLKAAIDNHADDTVVYQKADLFARSMPSTSIDVRFHSHPWTRVRDRGGVSSANDLIMASERALRLDEHPVPSPSSTLSALDLMKSMDSAGKISFQSLPKSVMGVYYTGTGLVGLSQYIPLLAQRFGGAFLAQVLFHEIGGHARDPKIKTGTVDENEGLAFLEQWNYLNAIFGDPSRPDHDGDKLVTLVMECQAAYKRHPNAANAVALGLAQTANAVFGTRGHRDAIEALVRKLYKSDGSPTQTSA